MIWGNKRDASMAKKWGEDYYEQFINQAKRENKTLLEVFDFDQSRKIHADYVCKYINDQSIVLEIACGLGRVSRYVAPYCKKLYCTDILKQAISLAKKELAGFKNIIFRQINGYDLKCFKDDSFDLVFSFGTFFHFDVEIVFNYFKEIKRVLKRNGVAIIEFRPISKEELETLDEEILQRGVVNRASKSWKLRYFSKAWVKVFADYFDFEILNDELCFLTVRFR